VDIKLKCECGQILVVSTKAAGKTGTCPACNKTIRIPTLEQIEKARQAQEPSAAKGEPGAPGTAKFKAPAPSKSRSKALTGARSSRIGRKGAKSRRKASGKTRAVRKSSALMKALGRAEEAEGGGIPQKKKPVAAFIVIGVLIVGGLVGAYVLYWGPMGKARARVRGYCQAMDGFIGDARTSVIQKFEKRFPASPSDFSKRLSYVKDSTVQVKGTMSTKMKKAYKTDNMMENVMDIFEDALSVIKERADQEKANMLSEENLKEMNERFTVKLEEAKGELAKIEKVIRDLIDKVY